MKTGFTSSLVSKLLNVTFSDKAQIRIEDRLTSLKRLLEPTHSKFGFAFNNDSSLSSIEEAECGQMSPEKFTKKVRKLMEKLMVFYWGEVENHRQMVM